MLLSGPTKPAHIPTICSKWSKPATFERYLRFLAPLWYILLRFWIDFGCLFEPKWCFEEANAKIAKCARRCSESNSSEVCHRIANSTKNQRPKLDAFCVAFFMQFSATLVRFGSILAQFVATLAPFWAILAPFWAIMAPF